MVDINGFSYEISIFGKKNIHLKKMPYVIFIFKIMKNNLK